MTRTALALCGVVVGVASATATAAPRVQVMIAGRTHLLLAPHTVRAAEVRVSASAKRCAAAAATPLAALAAARGAGGPVFRVRDYGGSCSGAPRDGGSLFVFEIGPDRNRGRDGWTYKVGTRSGTAGAADPSGPFGRGLLRAGAQITWFWCRLSAGGTCQRTLQVQPAGGRVAPGARVRVVVRGYDDFGHAETVRGARVLLGGARAITGRGGVAVLRAPSRPGGVRVTATRRGMVRAFDRTIQVG